MPEYLSPGVYVEEVDTGSKPIEGVSTSTAGMLGVTERGPANVPILITSTGEFDRWFGGKLDRGVYSDPGGTGRHCYLPDAVEGFFANGGKRVYITRVEAEAARKAATTLHTEPAGVAASTTLLRSAGRGSGLSNEPLVVLEGTNINVPGDGTAGDILRVGGGSGSEYRHAMRPDPTALPDATVIVLTEPIRASVTAGTQLRIHAVDAAAPTYTVVSSTAAGTSKLPIHPSAAPTPAQTPAVGHTLRIGTTTYEINQVAQGAVPTDFDLDITPPLAATVAAGDAVDVLVPRADYTVAGADIAVGALGGQIIAVSPTIVPAPGDRITIEGERFIIATSTPAPLPADPAITFDLTFTSAAIALHAVGATVVFDPQLALDASPSSVALVAIVAPALAADTLLVVPDITGRSSRHTVGEATRVTLTTPLPADTALGSRVRHVNIAIPSPTVRLSTAEADAGSTSIVLDQRKELEVGDLVGVGAAPDVEYRAIRSLPSPNSVGPDPGLVVFDRPLRQTHTEGTTLTVITATPTSLIGSTLEPASAGATSIALSGEPSGVPPAAVVAIEHADDTISYVTVDSFTALTPSLVVLDKVLEGAHSAGEPVVERVKLLNVIALDSGIWGDRLRVAVEHERVGLVAPTGLDEKVDGTHIRLVSPVGVEPGTVLELLDRRGAPTDRLLKIDKIDRRDNNLITLADPLTALQQNEIAAAGAAKLPVRSREFRLTVELLHQPDAARPRRNELVIASEVFPHLSMDPRHSRYVQKVIGDSDDSAPKRLSDRRSYGESRFIRVRDVHFADDPPDAALAVRVGPEPLVDVLPTGVRRPARLALDDGDDLIMTIDDATYIGVDSMVPEDRKGLYAFRNIDAISIIGCPGRTSETMQTALINHCEDLRYRFAVLDSVGPPEEDTLSDVQAQRQNYDTKYAALYYPWLMIPEVFPANLATSNQEPIPPSGHILGLYARVDVERGVHKAPANEVVRGGVVDLRRTLNKGEHDILNPFPTNINVIRDFRPNNRAIRVYGARVITSDPDWKYVNVRRLLIFIEKSIDLGLQWVVFEPNAEPLWARVKRSVSQFLLTVWRNGALEGVDRKEAFFVKCDRSTMTQADIDNGRLIIEVGVAPVKPAEFVIVRIGLFTAHADD